MAFEVVSKVIWYINSHFLLADITELLEIADLLKLADATECIMSCFCWDNLEKDKSRNN